MTLDMNSFNNALKSYYDNSLVENLVYKNNPFFALVNKMENFQGLNMPIVPVYANPQSRSVAFQRAQARSLLSNTQTAKFLLTRVKDYAIATIDNETLEASKGDAGAFMEAATTEIDGAINALTRSLAIALYKGGYGDIGTVSATQTLSSSTLQLANVGDVVNFEKGMELDAAATQTGAVKAYGTSGNGLLITGIDRILGTLTFAAALNDATNGIPTIAAGDYLFVRGDHTASAITKVAGLEAWCPVTAPTTGDAFFGQDRSSDVTRLAGQRLNGVGLPVEEVLLDGAAQVGREGFALSHYFMSFAKYSELCKALGSKVQYVDLRVSAQVGFPGVIINGVRGPIKVVPDMNCPSNRIWGVTMEHLRLNSIGKAVKVIDTDGMSMLRQTSADGVEVRYGFYGNLSCKAPASLINIQI